MRQSTYTRRAAGLKNIIGVWIYFQLAQIHSANQLADDGQFTDSPRFKQISKGKTRGMFGA
jgi:hypothetical protein